MAENSERSLRKPKRVFANLTNQINDFSFIWKLKERNSGWKANQGFSFPSVLEEREWGAEKWIRKLLQLARYEGLEKILTLWMMSVYLWEIAWEKGKKKSINIWSFWATAVKPQKDIMILKPRQLSQWLIIYSTFLSITMYIYYSRHWFTYTERIPKCKTHTQKHVHFQHRLHT